MSEQNTPHVLDAHKNSELKVREEHKTKNGNLDIQQLLDDIDAELEDHSDIDTLRAIRHVVGKRVEYRGNEK